MTRLVLLASRARSSRRGAAAKVRSATGKALLRLSEPVPDTGLRPDQPGRFPELLAQVADVNA